MAFISCSKNCKQVLVVFVFCRSHHSINCSVQLNADNLTTVGNKWKEDHYKVRWNHYPHSPSQIMKPTDIAMSARTIARILLCLSATAAGNASQDTFDPTLVLDHYTVDAYPCNASTHQPEDPHRHVHETTNKPLTICVEIVGEKASQDKLVVETIEAFQWTKNETGFVQVAIDDGMPLADGLTVFEGCPPNSLVCSFQTTLVSDYYNSSGEILGEGRVRLGRHFEARSLVGEQHRVLAKASIGVQVGVEAAGESDRPPLKGAAAGTAGPFARTQLVSSGMGILVAWMVLGGF